MPPCNSPRSRSLVRAATVMAYVVYSLETAVAEPPPLDLSKAPNETCKTCHVDSNKPKVDYNDPRCQECHTPEEPAVLQVSDKTPPPAPAGPPVNPMIFIPAGEFVMGNNGRDIGEGSGDEDEMPERKAYLDAYSIDKYEVTNAQFKAFVDATGRRAPKHWTGGIYPPGKADHPVVFVDWYDGNDYCHWAGKRLPTEEEWEKAARGGDRRNFPWGTHFDPKRANTPQYWLSNNQDGGTLPVGQFESGKSPYGVYDMAGNVYEWVASWYKAYPNNPDFNVHYGEKNKIVRGGSWYDCLSYGCGLSAPSYNRSRFAPEIRNRGFGFRCARATD